MSIFLELYLQICIGLRPILKSRLYFYIKDTIFRCGKSFSIIKIIIQYVEINKIQYLYCRNDDRNNSNWSPPFHAIGMQSLLEERETNPNYVYSNKQNYNKT